MEPTRLYALAIGLIEQQVQIFWLIFGAFLLAEIVLLGGVVSIAKEGPKELVFGGAVLGVLLVVPCGHHSGTTTHFIRFGSGRRGRTNRRAERSSSRARI